MNIDWALFRFPFDDPRWKGKFAIGGLLMLIAVFLSVPFFFLAIPVQGWSLQIMRRTARGEPPYLPEWEDWGKLFGDGLKLFVARIVYMIPVGLLMCCLYAMWLAAFFGMIAAAEGPRGMGGDAANAAMGGVFAVYGLTFVFMGIIFIVSLPLSYLALVASTQLAVTDSLASAFQFGEVWRLATQGFKHYALAFLVYFAASLGAGMLASVLMYTFVLSCLYPFAIAAAMIYAQAMLGALFGMARYHTGALPAEPAALPPPAIEKTAATESTPPEASAPVKKAAPPPPPDTLKIMPGKAQPAGSKAAPEPPPDTKKTLSGRRTPKPGSPAKPKSE